MKKFEQKNKKSLHKSVLFFASIFVFISIFSGPVSALSGNSFKKARIIDDSKFYRASSMSAASIQNFLNKKMPDCDTNGEEMYSSTKTRAQYGKSKGYPAPYICLRNKKVDRPSRAAVSGLCSAITSKDNQTAAQIIYSVSNACGVDSKVLIVMLQKEQALVTDDWPWTKQYRIAMGYGCPDDAACNSKYYGFFNQVYNAAKQLKNYRKSPDSFNYAVNRTSFVAYQANAPSCDGTDITMQNAATAALYNYTPYQPNAAALNNLYGTGNSCSAYGNRNFWRMYNDWFGSTLSGLAASYIKCEGQYYILENNDSRKRALSDFAVSSWGLNDTNFTDNGYGCDFGTYEIEINRMVRSRDSDRVYLLDNRKAYLINSQSDADAWGLSEINQSLPYVNSETIVGNFSVSYSLPRVAKSTNNEVNTVYVIDNDRRIPITGTSTGNTSSLQLIRGYDEVPYSVFSVDLLQTLTNSSSINYSFKIGSDWYLLDHNKTRKVNPIVASRWSSFLSGPTLDSSILGSFGENVNIGSAFRRDYIFYRLMPDSSIEYTNYDYIAKEWAIHGAPVISRLLTEKLMSDLDDEYIEGITGNVRLVDCAGSKYLVERFVPTKRPVSPTGLTAWGLNGKYAQLNNKACNYPTYSTTANRLIRSRQSKKVYYLSAGQAFHVYSQEVADQWSFGDLSNLPQFDRASIVDNLQLAGPIAPSP